MKSMKETQKFSHGFANIDDIIEDIIGKPPFANWAINFKKVR
jgi:hypothetical protein